MELIAKIFIRSWFGSAIKHVGAGLRYSCLWLFRRGEKVSYRHIRYGSEDFSNIDHTDNNLANGISWLPCPRCDSDSNSPITLLT